jgi:hypothetical protein
MEILALECDEARWTVQLVEEEAAAERIAKHATEVRAKASK